MSRDRAHPDVVEVLVVEDNPPEARLIAEILLHGSVRKNVRIAGDGDEALAFLRRQGPFVDAARPSLVILDLNLPGMDGREVLREIKNDPKLRCIPVVVLTTSGAPIDVRHAYDLQANAYLVKPVGLDAFTEAVQAVERFWLSNAQLPGLP
jgi:two-component system, chemotaxis family, response regulator Rcp1